MGSKNRTFKIESYFKKTFNKISLRNLLGECVNAQKLQKEERHA